jgi:hypothetical protein
MYQNRFIDISFWTIIIDYSEDTLDAFQPRCNIFVIGRRNNVWIHDTQMIDGIWSELKRIQGMFCPGTWIIERVDKRVRILNVIDASSSVWLERYDITLPFVPCPYNTVYEDPCPEPPNEFYFINILNQSYPIPVEYWDKVNEAQTHLTIKDCNWNCLALCPSERQCYCNFNLIKSFAWIPGVETKSQVVFGWVNTFRQIAWSRGEEQRSGECRWDSSLHGIGNISIPEWNVFIWIGFFTTNVRMKGSDITFSPYEFIHKQWLDLWTYIIGDMVQRDESYWWNGFYYQCLIPADWMSVQPNPSIDTARWLRFYPGERTDRIVYTRYKKYSHDRQQWTPSYAVKDIQPYERVYNYSL